PREQAAKPADVKIPLQAHFANKDDWCTPAAVDAFEKAMKAAGKSLELFRYDAEHAFVNEQRVAVPDRPCAELAWGRASKFCKKHLGGECFFVIASEAKQSSVRDATWIASAFAPRNDGGVKHA